MISKLILFFGLIFSFAPLPCFSVQSQNNFHDLLSVADRYYNSEDYDASITEYWRLLFFYPQHPYIFYAYYKAGMAHARLNEWDEATKLLRYGLQHTSDTRLRNRVRYQLAITLLAQQKMDLARLELFKLANSKPTTIVTKGATFLLGLVLTVGGDWQAASDFFSRVRINSPQEGEFNETIRNIKLLLEKANRKRQKKSPSLAKWLSTFLPGSGQVYAGEPLNGLNALALNSMNTYFLWKAGRRKSFRDTLLIFSLLWYRYYQGNRLHAEEAALNANQAYTEQLLGRVYALLHKASSYFPTERLTIERQDLQIVEQ